MIRKITLFFVLLLFPVVSQCQILKTKLDFVGGVGFPEYFHAGIRYQYYEYFDLGFYYGGGMGISNTIIRTWNFDHLIHFGPYSYFSNKPVWYARQGFTRSIQTSDRVYKYSFINLGLGRSFNISSVLGLNLDLGTAIKFSANYYETRWNWRPLIRLQINISI